MSDERKAGVRSHRDFRNREAELSIIHDNTPYDCAVTATSGIVRRKKDADLKRKYEAAQSPRLQES